MATPVPAGQGPGAPKKHTVRNVILGIVGAFFLLGACGALLGGNNSDTIKDDSQTTAADSQQADESEPKATPTTKSPASKPAPAKPTPKPAAPPKPKGPVLSNEQQQAVDKANDYLDYTSFSRKGLIDQLKFDGFKVTDSTVAVDSMHVDWNKQAVGKAKDYLDYTSFSRSGLKEQLTFDGFTPQQAEYGVSKTKIG